MTIEDFADQCARIAANKDVSMWFVVGRLARESRLWKKPPSCALAVRELVALDGIDELLRSVSNSDLHSVH